MLNSERLQPIGIACNRPTGLLEVSFKLLNMSIPKKRGQPPAVSRLERSGSLPAIPPARMKTPLNQKPAEYVAAEIARKLLSVRSAVKSSAHRYERRKIREQLRNLDWALPSVD
jgi:hypothetical protein